MSTYEIYLPKVFPYCLSVTPQQCRDLLDVLIYVDRDDVPQEASSFAVTVDNWDGTFNLWLSSVSYEYLRSITAIDVQPTVNDND